jgi:hypothetical protein
LGDRRWRDNRASFDGDDRLTLSAAGDPLERLARVIDFELFRGDLEAALARDPVLMSEVTVVQTPYKLLDD